MPQGHPQGADPRTVLESVESQIREKLEEELRALRGVSKFQLAIKVELVKANLDGSEEFMEPILRHKQEAVLQKNEIKAALEEAFPRLQKTLEKWTQRGSGWAVVQVRTLWLDIARYQPLRGGSYIPLPPELKSKKAVVNVKNKDDHCLRWALRSALFQAADHPDRPAKYPTADGLDFTGIDAPTPISQIGKVERPCHKRVRLGQGSDSAPRLQTARRHAQDKSAAYTKGRQVPLHLDKKSQPTSLRPEQTQRAEALLRALPSWVQARGSVGSPQAGVQGNWPDGCAGGNAPRGQANLSEPPQTAARALHRLRRLRSPRHESRRAGARPDKKQHPEDTTPRSMQLLLRGGAVRREDRGAFRIPGVQRSRTLPPSSPSGRA